MNPDFTIVTPSYNYGRYIRDCLESVSKQKGVSVEHLVFDGGSTDNTVDVVKEFPDVVFIQEADHGMCDAINKGFRAAKGKWVMWLNSDDRLKPGALAAVKKFVAVNEEIDVAYGGWDFIDSSGVFQKRMPLIPFFHGMLCFYGCYIGSTATFFRRSTILDEGHYLNESFRYVMDSEYFARLSSLDKKFKYFPAILADFRWHGENLSIRNFGKATVDDWLTLQKQFAESAAVRRAYGGRNFKNENLNRIFDGLRHFYWKVVKKILKEAYRSKLEEIQISPDDSVIYRKK